MATNEYIVKKLKKIRINASVSQTELAKRIGRDLYYVRSVELGEINIGVLNVLKFCEALNYNPLNFYEDNN